MTSRSGFSLIELTVALLLVGVLSAMAAPKVYEVTDYNDVMTAKRVVVTHFASAQSTAVQRGRKVGVNIVADSIWLSVAGAAGDSAITAKRSLGDMGVDVDTDQAQVMYDSRGFATGLPLTGAKIRMYGISVTDSLCVARSGMVLKGCL